MTKVTESNNLPPASTAWARQVTDGINAVSLEVDRFTSDQTNLNRANNTNIQRLVTQAAAIQQAQNDLTVQQAQLQAQQAYQASLVTVAAQGTDFLIDNIPGDQTNRWYNGAGDTAVTVNCPTGRLLVNWGAGSVESRAGNSTQYSSMRVMLSSPSGWSVTLGGATRTFVVGGTVIGMPFSSQRVFENVPVNEPITARVQFGTWSAGTSTLAASAFLTPFISAQVIPA